MIEMEFGDVGFSGGSKTGVPPEKPSEQGENQQQTQPTHITPGQNQTQATLAEASVLTTRHPYSYPKISELRLFQGLHIRVCDTFSMFVFILKTF